jgi:hypothetical protein
MQPRPIGMTIVAIAAAVVGVLCLVGAGAWWSTSEQLAFPGLQGAERFLALGLLAVGPLELVLAYGAWRLRPWAWSFGVLAQVLLIVLAVPQLGGFESARHVVPIVIAGLTLWYLMTPRAKAALGRL